MNETTTSLAKFGEKVWKWLKEIYPHKCDENGQMMIEWAEETGLCKKIKYDPAIHGEIEDCEEGDIIYYWGNK